MSYKLRISLQRFAQRRAKPLSIFFDPDNFGGEGLGVRYKQRISLQRLSQRRAKPLSMGEGLGSDEYFTNL